jgi:hypothetical protein
VRGAILPALLNAPHHPNESVKDEEAEVDELTFDEIYFSVLHGEIIEAYPDDRPYPSCLIYGMTFSGDPVHSVWAYNEENQWAVLVTVYRPDPDLWINWRERKRT